MNIFVYIFIFISLFFIATESAIAGKITYQQDTTIIVQGRTWVIAAGSSADLMEIDQNGLNLIVANGDQLVLKDPSSSSQGISGSSSLCNVSGVGSNEITFNGPNTLTLTPTGQPCVAVNTGGGSQKFIQIQRDLVNQSFNNPSLTVVVNNNNFVTNNASIEILFPTGQEGFSYKIGYNLNDLDSEKWVSSSNDKVVIELPNIGGEHDLFLQYLYSGKLYSESKKIFLYTIESFRKTGCPE